MKPAKRFEKITPFIVMEILEKIHEMEGTGKFHGESENRPGQNSKLFKRP